MFIYIHAHGWPNKHMSTKAIRNAKQQHMMSNDPINAKEVQQG